MRVRPYNDADAEQWHHYVLSHPSATVFHRLAWANSVQHAYGHEARHLTAWEQDRLVGVLPLFLVKSAFVGRVLVSVPYATYGGIVADTGESARALLDAAEGLCRDLGAEYLELRHREANDFGLPEIDKYDTFRKQLPEKAEDILPCLPRKTRAAARKGLDMLSVDIGPEHLDTIYDLYSITLRRLGSPNYRRGLFRSLQEEFGEDCVCLVVKEGDRPLAGVVSFVFRDEIVPYFSGSLDEGMEKNANNVMYVKLMEYAVHRGLRWFDFNRSRRDNHGPHAFKRYHGFEPTPLHYQVSLNKASRLPNLSPSNSKFALAIKLWRRLPLWATRAAGAFVTRWIP